MHDLDRTLNEFEAGIDALESGDFEYEGEYDGEYEMDETQLAAELLEINDEQELDQFLGSLVGGALSAGKAFLGSQTGKALTGVLKNAAGNALPQIGGVLGRAVAGNDGARLGRHVGQFARRRLRWELEAGGQDQELELAQSLVRVARTAARVLQQQGGQA
ncbi:MAG TPA: hypothetical protein VGR37_09360, partial [Longimicrobiaceae bacterium]|nr:hypothetical protein [Longimicrobiaceae bacterium]